MLRAPGELAEGDRSDFQHLCKLLESTAQYEFSTIRQRLKSDFKPFALATKGATLYASPSEGRFGGLRRTARLAVDVRNAEGVILFGRPGVPSGPAAPVVQGKLDEWELRFVQSFDELLRAAHFKRLTREEWETAEQEDFTVCVLLVPRMHVRILWPKLMLFCILGTMLMDCTS